MELKNIQYINCTDLNDENLESRFLEIVQTLSSLEDGLLVLFDFENTFLSSNIRVKIDEIFISFGDQIKSAAIMGVDNGVRKLIIRSLNHPFFISDDRSDCEEWLQDQ